jgi:hypothetical protein
MSQLNANSNGSRNVWKSARERERLRARFEIRERVSTGQLAVDGEDSNLELDEDGLVLIKTFLRHVSDGSVASFSLSVMSKQATLLTHPINCALLSEYKLTTLCTSRFGREYAARVLEFVSDRATCTLMEYAALLGEYKIIGSLIVGGIDPTVSGDYDAGDKGQQPISKDISVRLQRRFFNCFPLPLSTYIVKRVVAMRFQGWIASSSGGSSHDLCFGEPCHHRYSEEHFWLDLLDKMDNRIVGNIVRCPSCVCGERPPTTNDTSQDESDSLSQEQRCRQSLDKYLAMPADTKELKARSKKNKGPKKQVMASTWAEAVAQSLGNSRDVRQDKFFSFVERGSTHYLRGCLKAGIDVNLVNDYGQTALYLAAWQGNISIVTELLHYGADPTIAANGGSTALAVAKTSGHEDTAKVLERLGLADGAPSLFQSTIYTAPQYSNLKVLIPSYTDHPGAGACIIDEALRESQLEELVQLQTRLPLALSDKKVLKKVAPCSNRHYFSDSHGWIRPLLEATIRRTMPSSSSVTVLPHMRFLHYVQAGSILAPHVDLCRVLDGQRSTHTFILYLHPCDAGGETVLLQTIAPPEVALATIKPTRGRLLLFPHSCPHMGAKVIDLPKLLLRGEVILSTAS